MHRDEGEGDEGGGDPDEPIRLERGERLALILVPHVRDAVAAHPRVHRVEDLRVRVRVRVRG